MDMRPQLVVLWFAAALAACSVKPVSFTPPDNPTEVPSCSDGRKNGSETDVDCGGSCAPCSVGQACGAAGDCTAGVCQAGLCVAASCADHAKNGDETDTDCGGSCGPCADGKACAAATGCSSGVCDAVCQAATCSDRVKNGSETDADCGGSCGPCTDGKACAAATDCSSGVCDAVCLAATCSDRVKNGNETDADCGGPTCAACDFGKGCASDGDCAGAGICDVAVCRPGMTCAEIHQHHPGAGDGVYRISPAAAPFDVVCDMTRDGGGWTLLLKAAGDSTLFYSAPAWTDDNLINPTDLTTQPGNAKYASFLSLPLTTLRGELDSFRYTKAFSSRTAQQIFAGAADIVDGFPTFNTGAPNWSAQPNCHVFGVNIPYSTRARFGWSANQENDCVSNDTGIGLGVNSHGAGYICGSTLCSAGNVNADGNGLLWGR
jgi:hypothetical protein